MGQQVGAVDVRCKTHSGLELRAWYRQFRTSAKWRSNPCDRDIGTVSGPVDERNRGATSNECAVAQGHLAALRLPDCERSSLLLFCVMMHVSASLC